MMRKNICVLNLLLGVPKYQTDPTLCRDGLTNEAFIFRGNRCGIYFSNYDFTTPQNIEVTGAVDNMINFNDRITSLLLYYDASILYTGIPELEIWNDIKLPELKFVVLDSDHQTAEKICQASNGVHMASFDGKRYEVQTTVGEYVIYKHQRLPIMIHGYFQRCGTALCTCGAAVRSTNSLFVANFCGSNNIVFQNVCNKNDISITNVDNKYTVTVPSGAKLHIGMGVYMSAYLITKYTITASSLDFGMTKGLCGIFNNMLGDDFTMPNGIGTGNAITFADSWRITKHTESLFNDQTLQPIDTKATEFCTCKTESSTFPYGEPNFVCSLTTAMQPCRDANLPNQIYKEPCYHERQKRDTEMLMNGEPDQNESEGVDVYIP